MGFLPNGKEKLSGQALLIVLLGMTVVLTVVLSVVSRTVTDISITTYEEEAQRAFDAAEAGVEEALLTGVGSGGPITIDSNTQTTFDTSLGTPSSANDEFVNPTDIFSGESATFWFVSRDPSSGDLTCAGGPCLKARALEFCWGAEGTDSNSSETPAIEISLFYDDSGNPPLGVSSNNYSAVKVARKVFDPNSGRTTSNSFESANSCNRTIDGQDFAFSTRRIRFGTAADEFDISCTTVDGCLLMVKARMFYNDSKTQPIGLWVNPRSGSSLPAQGTLIESVGSSGGSTRKVNVFESFPEAPLIFDCAIFSFHDLSK